MVFNIQINGEVVPVHKGETIFSALQRNGKVVPTLCNMKEFSPTGACRMCVVEVEGKENLIPSCSYPVEEWMKIKTHSPRVLKARKTIVELLLSNHPDDCLYCERNGNCELQKHAEDLYIRDRRIPGSKSKHKPDRSGISVIRDPAKCILCGRCVRICGEQVAATTLGFSKKGSSLIITTAMDKPLNFSNCINCGQCIMFCPTGALTEKIEYTDLEKILADQEMIKIVQYSQAVAFSVAEEFNIKYSNKLNGIINSALKKIGFDRIFETSFASDIMIVEQAAEFLERLDNDENLPYLTGNCPAWVKFAEQNYHDFLPNLSRVRSPQQIMGSAIRNYLPEVNGIQAGKIYSVSIMPCTAMKYEAQKPEMMKKGLQDIDCAITSREFIRLIKLHGIDMHQLEPEPSDDPMGGISSAGKLTEVSGGSLEAMIRTIYYRISGKEPDSLRINKLRSSRPVKEFSVKIGRRQLKFAAVSGMTEAVNLLENVKSGKKKYDIIEIMACPGGCVNGGGQPIYRGAFHVKNRIRAIYDIDHREMIKLAHKNPQVVQAYKQYYGKPGNEKCKNDLHTFYSKKEIFI